MSFTVVGIDPGKTGAISFIDPIQHTLEIFDMPIRQVKEDSKRREVDANALFDMLDPRNPQHGFIEDVWSMTGDGNVGAFNFGDAYGTAKTALIAYNIDLVRVLPNVWKKNMRAPRIKDLSRARATELMPAAAPLFTRKKDDGRAESAMIALYGVFSLDFTLTRPLTLIGAN
jgi:crossover junction endodeoxyribonuclease RuvC